MKKIGNVANFKILLTGHADTRIEERKIDILKVVGCILSFGNEKLNKYINKAADVMIQDVQNDFSIVFSVKKHEIVIITVIDKADCFIKNKNNTIVCVLDNEEADK